MVPLGLITSFLGSGKGKLLIKIAVVLIVVAVVGIWIASLKGDIADLKYDNSQLESDISAYKLEIKNGETEITLLKASRNQTAKVIASLQEQVSAEQQAAKRYRIRHARAAKLLAKSRNYPVTNSTGVISHEKSRLAADFINDTLGFGLRSKTAQ